jgi:hypothetical protein
MSKLTQAAQYVIDRYMGEMMPRFDITTNWERIWAIERRFGLIGYGDLVEKRFRQGEASARLSRCREIYAKTMDSDSHARLQDAKSAYAHASR